MPKTMKITMAERYIEHYRGAIDTLWAILPKLRTGSAIISFSNASQRLRYRS